MVILVNKRIIYIYFSKKEAFCVLSKIIIISSSASLAVIIMSIGSEFNLQLLSTCYRIVLPHNVWVSYCVISIYCQKYIKIH